MNDDQPLSGAHLRIRATRATVGGLIMAVLVFGWPFAATRPDAFSKPYHGPGAVIDVVLRDSPPPLRLVLVCVLELYLIFELFTLYWPVLKLRAVQLFDGRQLRGLDLRGRMREWPVAAVDRHFSALGSIFVRSAGEWFRIPVHLLDLTMKQKAELRALLRR